MREKRDVEETITRYGGMVQKMSLSHVKNYADMEDIFQTIFLKYMMYDGVFENEEHKKAWLIRVTSNQCKDYLRTHFWKRADSIDSVIHLPANIKEEHKEVLEAIHALPSKYKDTIYLHYYEGYSAKEIAAMLDKSESNIYVLLSRGRTLLKKKLGGDIGE